MLGRAPKAIIIDQCRAMAIAIEEIFPNSHHRLRLWHIMKKLPAKLGGHAQYKMIKKQLKNIVYNSLTVDECDERWMTMIEHFNLENNDWLKSLYEQRNKWIPVYVKDKFWAGMSTSQRSESMNAFFDEYVHSKTSLKQFVEQYDNALKKKIEKEKHLDFGSFNSMIPVIEGPTIIHDEQLTKTFFSCCAKSNPRRNAASGDDWRSAFAAGTKGPVNDSFKSSPKSKSADSRGSSRYSDPAQNGETSLNSDSRRTPDRLPPQPPH
ncbi:hypothetical protein ZIOFF_063505 [Zingiber officinale]|uniref:Protein FAR1-RELATED SEQUENCE n=1 Tax=Zingiber officinale TaxID=94328 RepID=A0A8J5KK67_ZINOF|nr:hypothetical protein ZIOFF_063505 [Zingiber officinale]